MRTFAPVFDSGKHISRQLLSILSALDQIKNPIRTEFRQYDQTIHTLLQTDNALLQEALVYVLERRGKQLRPILTILSAKLVREVSDKTLITAASLELLHTASLIHDDVVDDSPTRRGAPSVHARWNNKVAVLVGDFLLAKVIENTANLRNLKILNIVADLGRTLSSGELLQIHANSSMWISEESYYKVIGQKTASLFAACTQAGAVSAGASMRQESALQRFGYELGLIFQIKDDILDYTEQEIGKPTMQDIMDGKATLPLICALSRAPQAESDAIRALAEKIQPSAQSVKSHADTQGEVAQAVQTIQNFVIRYDGIGYAQRQMEKHKQKAMEALSTFHDCPEKTALLEALQYAIIRAY